MDLPLHTILGAAIPVFMLLALGFGLRRGGVLNEAADTTLMRLVIGVFYPALFLDFIIGNPALKEPSNLVAAPLVGFATTAGGFLIAFGMARLIGLQKGKGLRTFAFCNGIYNYGYIPIPLIMVLFKDRGTLGVLAVHNVGVEMALWTVGIILLSGRFHVGALKRLVNPPLITLVVALLVNAAGLDDQLPEWLLRFISMLAACAVPIGILLAGAGVGDLLNRGVFKESVKVPVCSIFLRLGLLPLLFLLAAAYLPGLSLELKRVILVQAAMPAGIIPIVLARHYGGDPSVAVKVVLATTLCSIVTMPLWLQLGGFVLK